MSGDRSAPYTSSGGAAPGGRPSASTPGLPPRLLSKTQAAAYLGLSVGGFNRWRRDGKVPGPLPGTDRYDRHRLDEAIDALTTLGALTSPPPAPAPDDDPLAAWMKKRDERKNRGR